MLELVSYTSDKKIDWDNLVSESKNGTFLFYRDYMDYHSDRFIDNSFFIYRKGKLEGLIPGNIENDTFFSHKGLTYGGIIITNKITTLEVINIFDLLIQELKKININKVIYKPVPYIYHKIPAQEDIYALYKLNAIKIGCNISSAIYQFNKLKFTESRNSGVRKAIKNNIKISQNPDLRQFWNILHDNLINKYETTPAHNIDEITFLHSKFPNNIKLYATERNDEMLAGCIVFEMNNVIHVQYMCASKAGKNMGALDLLFNYLINDIYSKIPIFDFGHSNEQMGKYLNENLIFQKEGFGGRGVVYEIYEIKI